MPVDKELLEILVCPQCKNSLAATEKEDGLVCGTCSVIYPVKEDIPILLIDEATPLKPSSSNDEPG